MTPAELFRSWLAELRSFELTAIGGPDDLARDNLAVFSLADAHDARATPADVAAFLRGAYRAYSVAASRAGLTGFFYAWHDAQAGQLRTCAAAVASASDLPFRSALDIVDDPLPIAANALADPHTHGIPLSELVELERADAALDPAPVRPPLKVFARVLIGFQD